MTTSLLERERDIITNFKYKLDKLAVFVEKDLTQRQLIYLEYINKHIEDLDNSIDDLLLDISSTNNINPQVLEEMENYVINEKVKEHFLPYMLVYHMYLERMNDNDANDAHNDNDANNASDDRNAWNVNDGNDVNDGM